VCVCVLIYDADALVDVCYIDLQNCDIFLCVYVHTYIYVYTCKYASVCECGYVCVSFLMNDENTLVDVCYIHLKGYEILLCVYVYTYICMNMYIYMLVSVYM